MIPLKRDKSAPSGGTSPAEKSLGKILVPPGSVEAFKWITDETFRPDSIRLSVRGDSQKVFIRTIKVGLQDQIDAPMPADDYLEERELKMSVLEVGNNFRLEIQNNGDRYAEVELVLYGVTVK